MREVREVGQPENSSELRGSPFSPQNEVGSSQEEQWGGTGEVRVLREVVGPEPHTAPPQWEG